MTEINYSVANKFLKATGLKASKEGTIALQKLLSKVALEITNKAAELAKADNKKTLMAEYIEQMETKIKIE